MRIISNYKIFLIIHKISNLLENYYQSSEDLVNEQVSYFQQKNSDNLAKTALIFRKLILDHQYHTYIFFSISSYLFSKQIMPKMT